MNESDDKEEFFIFAWLCYSLFPIPPIVYRSMFLFLLVCVMLSLSLSLFPSFLLLSNKQQQLSDDVWNVETSLVLKKRLDPLRNDLFEQECFFLLFF